MTKSRIPRIIPALFAVCSLCTVQSAFAGSIVGWGEQAVDSSQLDANDFVAIAAGSRHSLALRSDGSIVGWGARWPDYGQATAPEGYDFVAIAAGGNHSLALRREPCQYVLAGDLNGDCRVNSADLAIMAASWLIDCELEPADPACVPK
ncbi:MAG: hypothetical protein JSU70_06565 [Phycisphaerales bacterium]|nr:MAG: hypothetical protein JSU70_06565 [Phycisphaerales bacterium]